jgi:quercetin dioxygenase-like cupin family protein
MTALPPTKVTLASLPHDAPMPLLERRRIIGAHAMISHITLHKGCFVPLHHHANEQFSYVLTGRLRFTFNEPGQSETTPPITVAAGETIHLPPNCPHAAEALEHTTVLDIFSPPSQTTGIDRPKA